MEESPDSTTYYAQRVIDGLEPHDGYSIARLLEEEIERRGLIEKYQNALIDILGLDMQVFNSAIEIGWYAPEPAIPHNTFEWRGHALLWLFAHPTPEHIARAFLAVTS